MALTARWARAAAVQLHRPNVRIALLTAALALGAATLYVVGVRRLAAPPAGDQLPWFVLAVVFALGEIFVVHVHLRREAHTLSLSEIAIVLGLFAAAPGELLLGQTLGVAAALVLHRRQAPLKLTFNLAQFAFTTALAALVFHAALTLGDDVYGVAGWSAALLAMAIAEVVSVMLVIAVISVAQARPDGSEIRSMLAFGLIVTAANTSLALCAIQLAHANPFALWLLAVPVVTVVLAYRGSTAGRRRQGLLQALRDRTSHFPDVSDSGEITPAILRDALEVFGAQVAELTVLSPTGKAVRTTVRRGDAAAWSSTTPLSPAERELFENDPVSSRILRRSDTSELHATLCSRGFAEALVALLPGDGAQRALLVVGPPIGDVASYTRDDLTVVETFASHAAMALQNGLLRESLRQVLSLEDKLRHEAFHDSLTGLANRALLLDHVAHALARPESESAVLVLDLDDFKTINDSLCHAAGDRVVQVIADRIGSCVRPGDTVARLGGDEFGVLLEHVHAGRDAVAVAERIMAALAKPVTVSGREFAVTATMGIATTDGALRSATELLRDADVAMYTAKADGKAQYRFFRPEMHAAVVQRQQLKADLQRALDRSEFELHYQPLVRLDDDQILAVESLVRWRHPARGLVSPAEFIPLAEETGLMVPIGEFVLRAACTQAASWKGEAGRDQVGISVNLSARQLREDGFVESVEAILAATRLSPSRLILEITESVAMTDTQASIAKLRALSAIGVRLAIDDFGTGYSSLSYLKRFPFDILKIAKPFVDGLGDGTGDLAFASSMVKLAQALDLEIVAEGIEQTAQVEVLRTLGCGIGQGFLYSRPVDARQLVELLGQPRLPQDGAKDSTDAGVAA
jgi:diguanylate cyclase (GGDEF)-like protein